MRYVLNDTTIGKFAQLGRKVWGVDEKNSDKEAAKLAIDRTEMFFNEIGMPSKLSEAENLSTTIRKIMISDENFEEMALAAVENGYLEYAWVPLSKEDVVHIYKMCL